MRRAIAIILLCAMSAGCHHPRAMAPAAEAQVDKDGKIDRSDSHAINANSFFGAAHVSVGLICAGRVRLQQGSAEVKDSCFSGDTDVVVCTDGTAANPIKCAPAPGLLSIAGSGEDLISYARVR